MTQDTFPALDASPARLRYVAALRGVVPSKEGAAFSYLQTGVYDPQELVCMAISNPEGQFYGLLSNRQALDTIQQEVQRRAITNITFVNKLDSLPSQIDFMCFDGPQEMLSQDERKELFDIAENKLVPNGIFCLRYKICETVDSLRQFLQAKCVPELLPAQQETFLQELGATEKEPLSTEPVSGTFETLAALLPRGFAYVGDAQIASNYIELSVSPQAQGFLLSYQDNLFYESMKDFALSRLVRSDVWVRLPIQQSSDMPTLFNPFTFGISTPKEKIPAKLQTVGGKEINLETPLFLNLIGLMAKLPMGVGDFLSHPIGDVFDGNEVLSSIQILVAAGIAQPMRGHYEARTEGDAQIVPTQSVNNFLNDLTISTPSVRLASPVAGMAITLSAREALVLQAIARAGLGNSVGALLQELERLSKQNPSLAAKIMDTAQPSPEMADAMLRNVIDRNVTRWYAYGLMAA